jgi:FixJ family two-component response regulator
MLLTDVVMPNLGGRELALRMREANPSLKVLYITGYAESALEAEASDEAGVGFLQKPFTPTVLAERVRRLLDSERASTSTVSDARQEPSDSRQT